MNNNITDNGILVATQNDFSSHVDDAVKHVPTGAARFLNTISDHSPTVPIDISVWTGDSSFQINTGQNGGRCGMGFSEGTTYIAADALGVAVLTSSKGIMLRVNGVELFLDENKLQALASLLNS